MSILNQYKTLISNNLKSDLKDRSRIYTPLLFSLTLLILFTFAFEEIAANIEAEIFIAEIFLISLFSIQLSFISIYEPERQDDAFTLMKSYPINTYSWFLAKFTLAFTYSLVIFVPTVLFAQLFSAGSNLGIWQIWLTGVSAIAGLSSMGVLLSTLTYSAKGRESIFPILYFPLTIPILLASIQASLAFISGSSDAWNWFGIIGGFDIIYFTLGSLLFGELISS